MGTLRTRADKDMKRWPYMDTEEVVVVPEKLVGGVLQAGLTVEVRKWKIDMLKPAKNTVFDKAYYENKYGITLTEEEYGKIKYSTRRVRRAICRRMAR